MLKPRVKGDSLPPYVSVKIQKMPSLEPAQIGKGAESHHSHACPSITHFPKRTRLHKTIKASPYGKHHPWILSRYITIKVQQLNTCPSALCSWHAQMYHVTKRINVKVLYTILVIWADKGEAMLVK